MLTLVTRKLDIGRPDSVHKSSEAIMIQHRRFQENKETKNRMSDTHWLETVFRANTDLWGLGDPKMGQG